MGKGKTSVKIKSLKKSGKALEDIAQKHADEWQNVMKKSEPGKDVYAYIDRKIREIELGIVPPPVSYEDSDQSPLRGDEAQFMRSCWATGMDNNPANLYMSDFLRLCFLGGYKGILMCMENKSGSEIKRMIAKRETLLNVSPIFEVIIGAREAPENVRKTNEHMKVLAKLLSLGADVNVHDIAGYTPLHHCLTMYGNETTLKMAEKLIRAGAKVDAKNRFGATPLLDATLANRYDFIEFLLLNGADQTVKDNDGYSPKHLCQHNPRKQKLMAKFRNINIRKEREENGLTNKCQKCSLDEGLKKCTGCYHVWYCGAECQREDWDSHKEECKKIAQEYRLVTYSHEAMTFAGVQTPMKHAGKTPKSHFVVKVQVPMEQMMMEPGYGKPISVYNKDRSFQIALEKENNDHVYDELHKSVVEKGWHGLIGFFHAIYDPSSKSKKFKINSTRMLPQEPW